MKISDVIKKLQHFERLYGSNMIVVLPTSNNCRPVDDIHPCQSPKCEFSAIEIVIS